MDQCLYHWMQTHPPPVKQRTQYTGAAVPMQPSSICEVKEEITTGLSSEVRSLWESAACPHKHSINQSAFVSVSQLR